MATVEHPLARQETMQRGPLSDSRWSRTILLTTVPVLCLAALLYLAGCGQTANSFTPAAANQVNSYFGSPFTISVGSSLSTSVSKFDHSVGQIGVTAFVTETSGRVPAQILNGTFATSPTGFLSITENFATSSAVISAQNPPLTGAWAVEIPGAGALANLLAVSSSGVSAAPVAMAENSACPNFQHSAPFLYVTVPNAAIASNSADYGAVGITTQGSAVTLSAQPYLINPKALTPTPTIVTGGCSDVFYGPLTAYPLNSFANPSNVELIAIGQSGLLVSSFIASSGGASPGAFGGGTGVIGVATPSSPVDVSAVIGAKYNGFIYAPQNSACNSSTIPICVTASYDITVPASAFGDNTANSQGCFSLKSSLAANNAQGAMSVAALPSANTLYGGEFRTTTGSVTVNDPTGANGSENCDVAIDLGLEDSANNGLFPNATVFIGSNYPPFGATNPWNCFGTTQVCAVSFPAAAVVGQVQGQYVIFVVTSAASKPAAQLPNSQGSPIPQPVGIYLFQKPQ
jgi:hypothetical protein